MPPFQELVPTHLLAGGAGAGTLWLFWSVRSQLLYDMKGQKGGKKNCPCLSPPHPSLSSQCLPFPPSMWEQILLELNSPNVINSPMKSTAHCIEIAFYSFLTYFIQMTREQ